MLRRLAILSATFTSAVWSEIIINAPQEIVVGRKHTVEWRRTPDEPARFNIQLRRVGGPVGGPVEIGNPTQTSSIAATASSGLPTNLPLEPLQGTVQMEFLESGSFVIEATDPSNQSRLGSSTVIRVFDPASPDTTQSSSSPQRPITTSSRTSRIVISSAPGTSSGISSSSPPSPSTTFPIRDPGHRPPRHSPTTPTPSSTETAIPASPSDNSKRPLDAGKIAGLVISGVAIVLLLRWLLLWLWRRSRYAVIHSTPYQAIRYYATRPFRHQNPSPRPPSSSASHTDTTIPTESKEHLHPNDTDISTHVSPSTSSLSVDDPLLRRLVELERYNAQQSREMAQLTTENELWREHHQRALNLQDQPPPTYEGRTT